MSNYNILPMNNNVFIIILSFILISCNQKHSLKEAIILYENKDYDKSEKILSEIIEIDSTNIEALKYLAWIEFNKKDYNLSRRIAHQMLNACNIKDPSMITIGSYAGRTSERDPYIEKNKIIALNISGKSSLKLEDYMNAEMSFLNILFSDSIYPLVNYHLGVTYEELAYFDKAITYFDKELELNPNHYESILERGKSYLKNGNIILGCLDMAYILEDEENSIYYKARGFYNAHCSSPNK